MGSVFRKIHVHDTSAPSVAVRGVTVEYDGVKALEDVTFELRRGERVAVVGPNGAGKSTLFKVIAGVLEPSKGEVMLYGGEPSRHICVSYVPQRSQVDLTFPVTVWDVVMMGRVGRIGLLRWPSRRDRELVQACLELVGIADLADRQIGELSGGQQQRVFIARALAQEAEVMLMDEPFTGLDVSSREEILQILDRLQEREVTVLVATHDLSQAAQRFDRVLILKQKLLGFGSPDQVLNPEILQEAFGEQLHLVGADGSVIVFSNVGCCGARGGDNE